MSPQQHLSVEWRDTSGAAISGASIAITSVDKNQTSLSTSDEHGRYSFLYLPVGSYQLRVEHQGFSPVVRALTLTVGQALDLPVRLPIAGLAETANVSSVPVVETVRTQVAETVLPREVENLPLKRAQLFGPRSIDTGRIARQPGRQPALRGDIGSAGHSDLCHRANVTLTTGLSSTASLPMMTPPTFRPLSSVRR